MTSRDPIGDRARAWRAAPWLVAGTVAVVAGGVVAAVTGPTGWEHGSWLAAYLVLVMGVAQIGLGTGQVVLAVELPARRTVVLRCALWNTAAILVILGTVVELAAVVSIGGIVLIASLALLAGSARRPPPTHRWMWRVHVALVLVLLVSAPIGVALSWLRS